MASYPSASAPSRWGDLNARVHAICGRGTCAIDVPLIEDFLLRLGIVPDEIIKRLSAWLRPVSGKVEVMILEVIADPG